MKKPFLLLILLFSISIVNLHAGSAIINGIHYSFDSNTGQCTVEHSSTHKTLIEVIIPDSVYYDNTWYSVTSIGNSAFSDCSELTSIEIPGSVTNVDQYAFYNCTGLNSIEIPGSMQIIDAYAFSGCSGLTSISFPDITIGLGDYAFSDCTGLTSVKVPGGRKRVGRRWIEGSYVFSNCTGLTSVSFYNVTTIGSNYFSGCSGLTSITIPGSVTSIGSSVFSGCSGLSSIVVSTDNNVYDSRNDCNAIIKTNTNTLIVGSNNTIIPSSVTIIGERAFYECSGLTSITIPINVTSIVSKAFYGCSGLSSISVSEGNNVYDSRNNCNAIIQTKTNILLYGSENTIIPDDVISIGNDAFYGLSGLTSISIPGSVKSIGNSAFGGCSGLTSISIPGSVTSIGNSAFSGCTGLNSITIPGSVASIADWAFSNSGLTSIAILSNETSIAYSAFYGCESIRYCIFGCNSNIIAGKISLDNVEKITFTEDVSDFSLFKFPESLDTLVSLATTPPKIPGFSDIQKENLIVQIPNGTLPIYLQADVWKEFLNYKEGDNSTISLPQLDIYYSNSLSVHLADKSLIKVCLGYDLDIEFSPDKMTLKLFSKGYEYAFDNVDYFDFLNYSTSRIPTAVSSIEDDDMISIIVEEGSVLVSGSKKNVVVMLVSADGKIILNTTTDGEGKVTIPMDNIEKGVYVVKTDGLTFKFAKL